jgi:hypothetical protein
MPGTTLHKLVAPVALRIQQHDEIAVIDPARRRAVASDTTLKFDLDHGA